MSRKRIDRSEILDVAERFNIDFNEALRMVTTRKAYVTIPEGCGECPKCHGTGVGLPVDQATRKYFPDMLHHPCDNCGGQTMSSRAVGYTRLRPSTDKGCLHEFTHRDAGRCYHVYTCKHCGLTFDIDSGN